MQETAERAAQALADAEGFYGHRLGLYRQTQPHRGFVYEAHGSINWIQCHERCEGLWPADGIEVDVDPETFRATGELPQCAGCGEVARTRLLRGPAGPLPDILMFGDWGFLGDRCTEQSERYGAWVAEIDPSRLVVIECGAGTAVPTVRWESERRMSCGATLVRIDPRESHGPDGTLGLPTGAAVALDAIADSLGVSFA